MLSGGTEKSAPVFWLFAEFYILLQVDNINIFHI